MRKLLRDSDSSVDSDANPSKNSTSNKPSTFFKIPKKMLGLKKLCYYLRLLEPREDVASNHTYDLVLFTTADSQVGCRSIS